jgi:hypothetical protein
MGLLLEVPVGAVVLSAAGMTRGTAVYPQIVFTKLWTNHTL